MTEKPNPFAALLDGVPRLTMETTVNGEQIIVCNDGPFVRYDRVIAALAAAVPADLAEAVEVLEGVTPGRWKSDGTVVFVGETLAKYADGRPRFGGFDLRHSPDPEANARFIAWCREGVPALIARIAAQEAQIKGLAMDVLASSGQAQEAYQAQVAAETALAAMTKERDELRACIAWVDEVYPARIEAGGAGIQITWEEFNAMQAAIGVTVDARIGGPEGKAVHNQRLRVALAAERAKTAKLVDLLCLADEAIMQEHGCFPLDRTNERQIFLNDACTAIRNITGDDYTERKRRARAAITEADQ